MTARAGPTQEHLSPLPRGGREGEKRLKCASGSKAEQVASREKPSGRRHNNGSGRGEIEEGQTNAWGILFSLPSESAVI
ncbi:hypothetical protein VPH35_060837 [Triticum aestivum]